MSNTSVSKSVKTHLWYWKSIYNQDQFYNNYHDDDWFFFVKRCICMMEIAVLKKNILFSVIPLFIIHIIAEFCMPILYPMFIIPNNDILELFAIKTQKKQLILNQFVYKLQFIICNQNLQIKHRLSYYPNRGLFYCCNLQDKKIISSMRKQFNNTDIVTKKTDCGLYICLEIEYKPCCTTIMICVKWCHKSTSHYWFYDVDNKIFNDYCVVGLLNVQDYQSVADEDYETCSIIYKQ